MDGFNFQPGSYLFILLPRQQNELLNRSLYRLGQLSPASLGCPKPSEAGGSPEAFCGWWVLTGEARQHPPSDPRGRGPGRGTHSTTWLTEPLNM